jgi:predicted NUDIX family NTP pyrophosphohydrolase
MFEMEWPLKSSQQKSFPEVDKAQWFTCDEASRKINPAQVSFIAQLLTLINQ